MCEKDKQVSEQKSMKNFGLIGAAGYIAPRHMKAIKETGNQLVAALDLYDSVGIMDTYFPEADFFIEPERFDRHLDKLRRNGGRKIEYVSICSPNYLHDAHIRMALRNQAHAICEKPVVLNPWNIRALQEIEKETGKKVFTVLQVRLHPAIQELKKLIDNEKSATKHEVDLTYITSRGRWYFMSWKGDVQKSGGVATNIGIHFFDLLSWIFGHVQENIVHLSLPNKAAGFLELEKARVRWFLSLDENDLPQKRTRLQNKTFRSIKVDGKEIEFSEGFTELHTETYRKILSGEGYGLDEALRSVEIVYVIRNARPVGLRGEYHPFLKTSK